MRSKKQPLLDQRVILRVRWGVTITASHIHIDYCLFPEISTDLTRRRSRTQVGHREPLLGNVHRYRSAMPSSKKRTLRAPVRHPANSRKRRFPAKLQASRCRGAVKRAVCRRHRHGTQLQRSSWFYHRLTCSHDVIERAEKQ